MMDLFYRVGKNTFLPWWLADKAIIENAELKSATMLEF